MPTTLQAVNLAKPKHPPARDSALRALLEVAGKQRSLSTALPFVLEKAVPSERGLIQELVYGTLRQHLYLQAVLERLMDKALREKDKDIQWLLLMGCYQILFMETPAHAAVSETVAVTTRLRKQWAKGLVNAVLRRLTREREAIITELEDKSSARYAHPLWFIEAMQKAWPQDWQAILEANNQKAPMALRVNALQGNVQDYQTLLAESGIEVSAHSFARQALVLDRATGVENLPDFFNGRVSVQDPAAQLAAQLLEPQAGEYILDACAAPGGKTGHLLESAPELRVDALDSEEQRLVRVEENLQRLQLKARLFCGDAAAPESWWQGEFYDRILLDAPCSATGVIRRHPDIKLLRSARDIVQLVQLQGRILEQLWPLLKPGGILLYATCSVMPVENSEQVEGFLKQHPDAEEWPINEDWGRACACGRQILPGEHGMDGFYYARLRKRADGAKP